MRKTRQIRIAVRKLLRKEFRKVELEGIYENSLAKPLLAIFFNKFIFAIQKKMVPCHFKNWLLSLTGLKVGYDACIPHNITFDPYFPELIDIGQGAIIGGESTLLAHTVQNGRLTLGRVEIAPRTLVGGLSLLLPGSRVSKNSILALSSRLNEVVPEGEIWAGSPAKCIKKMGSEDIQKYFGSSTGSARAYYRSFKKLVKKFRKDKSAIFIKIHYNGSRLNAGNDWWRARNFITIYWSGILVEVQKFLPACWLKNFMLRLAGAKIGKNVKIGRNVILDHLMTWSIEIGDDVTIEHDAYIDGHSYTVSQSIFGRVKIGDGVIIRHHALISTGTIIGDFAVIEPYSFASKEIPPGEVWGGNPAKFIKKRDIITTVQG